MLGSPYIKSCLVDVGISSWELSPQIAFCTIKSDRSCSAPSWAWEVGSPQDQQFPWLCRCEERYLSQSLYGSPEASVSSLSVERFVANGVSSTWQSWISRCSDARMVNRPICPVKVEFTCSNLSENSWGYSFLGHPGGWRLCPSVVGW